jgi:hypothetical protein
MLCPCAILTLPPASGFEPQGESMRTLIMIATAAALTTAGPPSPLSSRAVPPSGRLLSPLPPVIVYKDPACGCCRAWVERMRAAGFEVQIHDVSSAAAREDINRQQGVTQALAACHTAVVGGYVVEGHVPPELVKRILVERPKIAGLAVPGMPAGSPGMEGMGTTNHYAVLAFTADGKTRTYDTR